MNFWAHNGLLNLVGEKMSKSTGHFFAIEDIVKEFDPDVMRFYLLSSHYRSPMEFSRDRLAEARSAVGRMSEYFQGCEALWGMRSPKDRSTAWEIRTPSSGRGRGAGEELRARPWMMTSIRPARSAISSI